MKIDRNEIAHLEVAQLETAHQEWAHHADMQAQPRLDLYVTIHKALRALMADTLLAVGRMDTEDDREIVQTGERVLGLLEFCSAHLHHENDFVHAAIEARSPTGSQRIAREHDDHVREIASLTGLVRRLLVAPRPVRAGQALDLYRQLSLFVAHNFEHMLVEETAHNALLWAHYTDAELQQVHGALVASIPPAEMMVVAQWMIPFMNPAERTLVLGDMQQNAPAPAFEAILQVARERLNDKDWTKLARSLGLPPVPGLVTV